MSEVCQERVVVLKGHSQSQYQQKSAKIKWLYYPILEWREARLKKTVLR